MHISLRRLLIYTCSFIYARFNRKIYGRVFNKKSYQFISKFDTVRHKFHCHIRLNALHLFKYSIYLFFQTFRAGVGEVFIGGKLLQIFIQNLFEVILYLMSPMRNRVTNVYRKAKFANYSL